MSKHHHDDSGDLHFEQVSHHGTAYEDRDLGGRGIIVFLIVLVVATAMLCLVVWGYFEYSGRHFASETPRTGTGSASNTPTTFQDPTQRFPKPALQTDDVADMNKLRSQEDSVLKSYGWVDQNAGLARIPIDEAMKVVAQRLPVRPATQAFPKAEFGSGTSTPDGAGGGTRPETKQ
jgi:hypothetical protein